MTFPWEAVREDEWRPLGSRTLFGGESGESGGPGDGGYEGGGATTGGGDWGSSGSYDASSFAASDPGTYATALADSPGGYYDTGGAGIAPGALGAEYGGAFGLSGISGQPGTNAFGAELDAGGGGYSGVGNAINSWALSTAAGAPGAGSFADLSGGGFSGYTGYTGDGSGGFGGFGGGSYETGGGYYEGGGGGGGGGGYQTGGGSTAGTYGLGIGSEGGQAGGGGGYETGEAGETGGDVGGEPSGGPSDIGGDIGGGPAGDDEAPSDNLGAPAPTASDINVGTTVGTTEGPADTSSDTSTDTSEDGPAPSAEAKGDDDRGAEPGGIPEGVSREGLVPAEAAPNLASPDISPTEYSGPLAGPDVVGDRASPSIQDQTGFTTNFDATPDFQGSPYADFGREDTSSVASRAWDAVMQAITPTDNPNESLLSSLTNPFDPNAGRATQTWADMWSSITNPNNWASPTTQQTFESLFGGAFRESNSWVSPQSPMGTPWGSYYGGAFGGPDVVGDRSAPVDWGSVFEGTPQGVDWGSVFEGTPSQEDRAPSVEAFIPGDRTTDFNYDTSSPYGGAFGGPDVVGDRGAQGGQTYAPDAVGDRSGQTYQPSQAPPSIAGENQGFSPNQSAPLEAQQQPPENEVQIVDVSQLPYLPGPALNLPVIDIAPEALPGLLETLQPGAPTTAVPPQETPEVPPQQALEVPPQETPEVAPTNAPAVPTVAQPTTQQVPEAGRPTAPTVAQPTQQAPNEGRPSGSPTGLPTQAEQSQEHRGDQQDNPPVDPNPAPPAQRSGVGGQVTHGNLNPGTTRNLQITSGLQGLLETLGRNIGVDIRVGSGGQPSSGAGRTGSHRHDVGRGAQNPLGAADVTFRDARDGHLLDARNPADLARLQEIASEAARLGATGIGFGLNYMGPNTMHIGGGPMATWGGAPWLPGAVRQGTADRGRGNANPQQAPTQQAAVPLPRGRSSDAPAVPPEVTPLPPQEAPPRPPADIPPPAPVAPDVPRPPADIPVQTVPPALAARTAQSAMQFAHFLSSNLAKSGKLPSNREEGQKALNALAQELARAGYPANIAQKTILEVATQGSIKAGYGPDSAYNALGHVTQAINEMATTAMQGYRSGKTPEVQGPPSPAQQRSQAFGGVTPAGFFPATRPEAMEPGPTELGSPPPAPPPGVMDPNSVGRQGIPSTLGLPAQPDAFQKALEAQKEDKQASLLDFLSNFNPISTAEAKGRGRDTTLDQALALAREGGSLGGQPGTSVIGHNVFTFYAPGASGPKGMEGPMVGSKGNPLTTLDDVRNGAAFVSLAGHPAQFGQQIFIGNITYRSPVDGQQHTLNNVIGRVDDSGGNFGGRANPDQNHFDIAVGDFSRGWNDTTAGRFVATNYATAVPGRGIGSDFAASGDMPSMATVPSGLLDSLSTGR